MRYEIRQVHMHYELWDRVLNKFIQSYDLNELSDAHKDMEKLENYKGGMIT